MGCGNRVARRLCRQGPRYWWRYRPDIGRGLPKRRERGGHLRQIRQAGFPRPRHLDDRRSGQTGGAAVHPRADRQCALRRAGRCGRDCSRTSCMRAAWSDRRARAAWFRRWPSPAHHACIPVAGLGIKPDEVPAILQRGERVLSRREAAGYGQGRVPPRISPSRSTPATPKASGNPARRSRPISPGRYPSAEEACDGVSRGALPRQHQSRRTRRA